jgi:hypothetical protein
MIAKNTSNIFTPLDMFPRDFKHIINMQCSPKLFQITTNEFQNTSNKFSIQLRNPQEMESTTVNHAAVPNAENRFFDQFQV